MSFITHVQELLAEIHLTICIVIHCMENSWYGRFRLLMPQNAINADFGNASLPGTLPYRLTWRLCEDL
jgi:hypothetical protein